MSILFLQLYEFKYPMLNVIPCIILAISAELLQFIDPIHLFQSNINKVIQPRKIICKVLKNKSL